MNKDEVKGKVNETLGKVSGDESKELKGKAQGAFGKAKEKVEEEVDKVAKKANEFLDKKEHRDDVEQP
ncbi:CsbD family protein [Vagococcus lutrae]|uniref:CsbD family protein n=1 Tax=Vagococcus lutrae TaxID=81947 RepID=UPI00200D9441|nr:CsbD family protein [Vagococcus lutrae]UQF23542.1 CsbD family protein [Vagococcus lutrae]UQF64373.1 CsbD family protein [Vagococcus lutrae]